MSVYRPRRKNRTTGEQEFTSPYWHFDFQIKIDGQSRRFHGSTGETSKRRAEEFERAERRRVRTEGPNDHLTLADACLRYHDEVTKGQANEINALKAFEHCVRLIGASRRLVHLTADDIAIAVRKRAGEAKGTKNPKPIAPATVNRQIIEPMRQMLRRAKHVWGVRVDPDTFDWKSLRLKEPKERVREFTSAEADRFWQHVRPDYFPFLWFLGSRGLRVNAVIGMTKNDLDEPRNRIRIWKKGEGLTWIPVTRDQMRTIAAEAAQAPGVAVWSYQRQRSPDRGKRVPISYESLKRTFATTLRRAGIDGFRIHDMRHDFASKLLRATRDLALVQKSLGHADITSTVRYAHVLEEDIRDGLQALESRNSPEMAGQSKRKS